MTQPHRRLAPDGRTRMARHGKHKLDQLDATRVAKHLVMFHPSELAVKELLVKARASIPGMAETAEVLKIWHHNPDCMLAFARKSKFDAAAPVGEGLIFALPLNIVFTNGEGNGIHRLVR